MILPASSQATLLLLVVSMICWGSWANTQKLAGKWRYELYYFDFALGFALLAASAAFTLGSLNPAELTFQENFLITGYRNMAYAAAAGMVFNLGNIFLAGVVSVAGLSVAFPLSLGMALLVSTVVGAVTGAQDNLLPSVAGAGLLLAALLVTIYIYSNHLDARAESAKKAAFQLDPRSKQAKRAPRAASAAQAVVLGVISGIALGLFRPLVDLARGSDSGLAPYGLTLLFAVGILFTTVFFSPFFFNFPVAGGPLQFRNYFRGTGRQHVLGLCGGILAGMALLAGFIATGVPPAARAVPAASFALTQGGTLLAVLWGLLAWHEFKGSGDRVRMLWGGMLLLYAAAIAVLAVGQN